MRRIRSIIGTIALLGCASATIVAPVIADEEAKAVMDRLLAPVVVAADSGFTATTLVPPGELYDPLFMTLHAGTVWLNDDGGEEGEKGSRILAIGDGGVVSVVIGLGRLLPTTGFGIAPQGFGAYGGYIFALAQAKVAAPGATDNHVILRIDPATRDAATVVCTLPPTGDLNGGISGYGVDARFGPPDSPFANKFFAVTLYNNTIYQLTADGVCSPFVTFDGEPWGSLTAIAFSADGQSMLVGVMKGSLLGPEVTGSGAVLRVSPTGAIDSTPVVQGLARPFGLALAPKSFGTYAGQLFITDVGNIEIPVPMTQALQRDGKLYRATANGKLLLVASGFVNPTGILFVDDAIWVADINGDFIAGKRELPDGAILKIAPK